MHRVGWTIALLLLGAGLAGCGSSSSGGSSGSAPIPAPQHPARGLPMLATSTLPDLDHTERGLDLSALAAEGPKGGDLQAHLAAWSYRTGSEREFKGGTPSRYLDVVSRTLVFGTAAGARDFVGFVRDHPGTYVGALRLPPGDAANALPGQQRQAGHLADGERAAGDAELDAAACRARPMTVRRMTSAVARQATAIVK